MSIIFAILIFSFLIFIHELGHFVVAKMSGVQVNEFALFMGPALIKWKRGETLYSIRCIPIGGYCAMEGEDSDTDNPRAFKRVAWWKQLCILLAGAFMNFVTGVVIFAALLLPQDQVVVPEVREFTDCCIFQGEQGLQVGDRILEIDGERIYLNNDISIMLTLNQTGVFDVVVERDGREVVLNDLQMAHTHLDENGQEYVHYGFGFGTVKDATFGDRMQNVWYTTVDNIRNVRLSLQMLFTGQAGLKDMTGPIGIIDQMGQMAEDSASTGEAVMNMLYFGGFIAVNLAVMNLLPIPALDGGRALALLLTTMVEKITRKKINPKYEGYIHMAGMVLLLALMAIILFKDVFTIFTR